ncbi:hypothetical protein AZA_52267 [Nitrospirillum viridazoti Y2]|uniref:Uncharacterized protein n=1 Tax=Nitrospirillum amazonense TaxID=28077 RepID=A0A560IXX7_9PROT|nr:hypothetical protein [Nitrospirillum amazonense]EGY01489.1 hypothetical protein AZA_52267 [Nitrospirillum amazonense Y2]TWB63707.1 hypothetical protein FBZ92_103199 [Nitrospirillum amazonense]
MASVPLAPQPLPAALLRAAVIHHRLVDAFIQLTRTELARQRDDYARDSLNELLDVLKAQLAVYGPDAVVPSPAGMLTGMPTGLEAANLP